MLRKLGSPRLAIGLLLAVTLSYIAGMTVPQKHLFSETDFNRWLAEHDVIGPVTDFIGLTHFFNTWWFGLLIFALTVNTAVCTWQQGIVFRQKLKRLKNGTNKPVIVGKLPTERIDEFLDWAGRRGYKFDSGSLAVKSGWGYAGSFIFHLALLVIVCGGLVSFLFIVRGDVQITEGQAFTGQLKEYRKVDTGWLARVSGKPFTIGVDGVEVDYPQDDDWPTKYKSFIVEIPPEGQITRREEVAVNKNFYLADYILYMFKFGYAPAIIIKENGTERFAAYTQLRTIRNKTEEIYQGNVILEDRGEYINITFLPNDPNGSRPYFPGNPKITVTLYRGGQEKGAQEKGISATLGVAETKELGPYTVSFPEYRRWAGYFVVKDPGRAWVICGGWLAVFGLMVWFFIVPKSILLKENGSYTLVEGFTAKYPAGFREELREKIIASGGEAPEPEPEPRLQGEE